MGKPILATNIDGFLIKHEAFIKPHELWFDRLISLTGDSSLSQWKNKKDYFKGVDIAMKEIMPKASDEERTKQARNWYQEDTITYIRFHPEVVYKKVAEILKKLKEKYTLALITTNTNEHIDQMLEASGLQGIYNIIFSTAVTEKPDKASLFQNFVKKYGKPEYYLAARSKEGFEECLKLGSICIYVTWDEFDTEIAGIVKETIKTPEELEIRLVNN